MHCLVVWLSGCLVVWLSGCLVTCQTARTDTFKAAVEETMAALSNGDTHTSTALITPSDHTKRFRLKVVSVTNVIGYSKWEILELPHLVDWLRQSYLCWHSEYVAQQGKPAASPDMVS